MGRPITEFYKLKYCELTLILEGYQKRLKSEWRLQREESAWLAHIFLLPHTKKDGDPITPAKLLGRKERKRRPKVMTGEEAARAWLVAKQRETNGE